MELVSVSECARRIGVHKSTISRQIAAGIIPNRNPQGTPPMVNPDEALAARRQNVDPLKSSSAGIGLRFEDEAADEGFGMQSPMASSHAQQKLNYNAARTATEAIKAQQAQLDYLKNTGVLVEKAAVEREEFELGRRLRDRLMALPRQISGVLAVETDERQIESLLRNALRDCLAGFIRHPDPVSASEGQP